MLPLTEERLKTLQYSIENNGITLSEAGNQIYQHKSTASHSLKKLQQHDYLYVNNDTPVNTTYRKLWMPTDKAKKIIEIMKN